MKRLRHLSRQTLRIWKINVEFNCIFPTENGKLNRIARKTTSIAHLDVPTKRSKLLSFLDNSMEETQTKNKATPCNSECYKEKMKTKFLIDRARQPVLSCYTSLELCNYQTNVNTPATYISQQKMKNRDKL